MAETVFNPDTDDLDPPEIGGKDMKLKTKQEKKDEEEQIVFQVSGGEFDTHPERAAPRERRRRPKMGK